MKFSNVQIRCQLQLKSAAPQAPMPPTSTLHIFEAFPFPAASSLLPVPAGRYASPAVPKTEGSSSALKQLFQTKSASLFEMETKDEGMCFMRR